MNAHLFVEDVKVEAKKVDGNGVLASVVLLDSGEKRLREEEPREPEDRWGFRLVPVQKELEPSEEVVDVASERLQRRVRLLHPHPRYFALQSEQKTEMK